MKTPTFSLSNSRTRPIGIGGTDIGAPENKKILIAADVSDFQPIPISSIKVLGVAVEWQLSGKIK